MPNHHTTVNGRHIHFSLQCLNHIVMCRAHVLLPTCLTHRQRLPAYHRTYLRPIPSVHLHIGPFTHRPIHLSAHSPIGPFTHRSIYPSVLSSFIHQFSHPSGHYSISSVTHRAIIPSVQSPIGPLSHQFSHPSAHSPVHSWPIHPSFLSPLAYRSSAQSHITPFTRWPIHPSVQSPIYSWPNHPSFFGPFTHRSIQPKSQSPIGPRSIHSSVQSSIGPFKHKLVLAAPTPAETPESLSLVCIIHVSVYVTPCDKASPRDDRETAGGLFRLLPVYQMWS